jgi:hypothetical protein
VLILMRHAERMDKCITEVLNPNKTWSF